MWIFSNKFSCLNNIISDLEIADCCSSVINNAVDNAFVSCSTPVLCKAKCCRGYIFPIGITEESYSCQNGVWTPMLFS